MTDDSPRARSPPSAVSRLAGTCCTSTEPHFETKVIDVPLNDVVDLVVVNNGLGSTAEIHPLHIHGYKFWVIATGTLPYPGSLDLIPERNVVDPLFADTYPIRTGRYYVLRLEATNAGMWHVHCHLLFHMFLGLQARLESGFVRSAPFPHPRRCGCGRRDPWGAAAGVATTRCACAPAGHVGASRRGGVASHGGVSWRAVVWRRVEACCGARCFTAQRGGLVLNRSMSLCPAWHDICLPSARLVCPVCATACRRDSSCSTSARPINRRRPRTTTRGSSSGPVSSRRSTTLRSRRACCAAMSTTRERSSLGGEVRPAFFCCIFCVLSVGERHRAAPCSAQFKRVIF